MPQGYVESIDSVPHDKFYGRHHGFGENTQVFFTFPIIGVTVELSEYT